MRRNPHSNSFSTSTNDPVPPAFGFADGEMSLGNTKRRGFPSSFSLYGNGGPRGEVPSSAASVTYSFKIIRNVST